MALTIKSAPSDTSSVSSEMLFVIHEATKAHDEVTYPNYKYVLDVYVNSALVARLKTTPDPTNRFGIFDISRVLQNYAPSYDLNLTSTTVDYDVRKDYYVKLGEEYNDTTYLNLVTDATRYFFKSYKPRSFTTSSVLSNGLASNMPSEINSYGTPINYQLIPYFSNVTGVTNLAVNFYNKSGTLLNTTTFNNSGMAANKLRQFNIQNTNSEAAYALLTGPFSMRINYHCTNYPIRYFVWLNPFGGYESQVFSMVSKKTIDVEKKAFARLPYKIDASGVVSYSSNGGVFYGQRSGYSSAVKKRMKLTSHLLTDNEYEWLADLFISPQVFMYDDEAGGFVPVVITQNNYEYKTYLNSKLSPLEFEVEYDSYNAQTL